MGLSVFMFSCGGGKVANGVIVDATINSLSIASKGDTLTFGTMGADRTEALAFVVGDSAIVYYSTNADSDYAGNVATRIIVRPGRR